MVQAHAYWRLKGLAVDLVIWNEDHAGYRQSLQEQIVGLIAAGIGANIIDKPGGIFVRSTKEVSIPNLKPTRNFRPNPQPDDVLPRKDLIFYNELGGFTPDGREYVITLSKDRLTPAPWVNVLANKGFGYSVFEHNEGGIISELWVYVATLDASIISGIRYENYPDNRIARRFSAAIL